MAGATNIFLAFVIFSNLQIILRALASNPECGSQLECQKDIRVTCRAPEIACCSGLLTGTDYKGNVYLFQKGSCGCCEKCEVKQEEPPKPTVTITGPGWRRQERAMSYYSRVIGNVAV